MTSAMVEPRAWPWRRWWLFVGGVFCAQLALILGLSDKSVRQPRPAGFAPSLHLAAPGDAAELVALNDPTLFALPHRQGFAGLAWLRPTQPPLTSFTWPVETNWLQVSVEGLGSSIDPPSQTAKPGFLVGHIRPEPVVTMAESGPLPGGASDSRLRVEGGLAGRKLLAPLKVPSQPHTDLLNDTVVQIMVNADGWLLSVPTLLSGSGSPAADQEALRLARCARFNAVMSAGPGRNASPMAAVNWGRLVFEWHTVPTNARPAGP
jgi:TonB family protein